MASHNIVAIYPSRTTAERVRDHLIDHGFSPQHIRLSAEHSSSMSRSDSQIENEQSNEGFFGWLFGTGVSDHERKSYRTGLTGERTAVSVLVDEGEASRVEDLLDQFSPIDLHEDSRTGIVGAGIGSTGSVDAIDDRAMAGSGMMHAPGRIAPTSVPSVGTPHAGSSDRMGTTEHASTTDHTDTTDRTTSGDQVIPVLEEQLNVGKRQTERRYRVRTHVVEKPVEQQVHLKDERVIIERRAPTGTDTDASIPDGSNRDFEVIERHEQPVVAKEARAVEEVVIRKEDADRVETVRDNVRRTEVDVDKGNAENSATKSARTDDAQADRDSDHVAEEEITNSERVPPGALAPGSDTGSSTRRPAG